MHSFPRIDLTRMECKDTVQEGAIRIDNSIDLTRMECKGGTHR